MIGKKFIYATVFLTTVSLSALAQTEAISYQGKLTDGGQPANGVYDFQFKVFALNGVQISDDAFAEDVVVTNGIFKTSIPLNSTHYAYGSNRVLEIAVRPGASTGAYTVLTPRQEMNSVPVATLAQKSNDAVNAQNANALGFIPANQYVQTSDARLSDARPPTAGSTNYIQNGTGPQASSNFHISGSGQIDQTLFANQVGIGANPANGYKLVVGGGTNGLSIDNGAAGGTIARFGNGLFTIDGQFPGMRMYMTEAGTTGFGTVLPTHKITIVDSGNNALRVQTDSDGGRVASFGGKGNFEIDAPLIAGGRFVVKENGNVGVGTNAPAEKLHVNGNVRVTGSVFIANPQTLVITSPNGSCWGITVNNSGALGTFSTPCPSN